ncbi:MAG: hypothetical protein AVDCRST_MAG66-1958 [uncultured Pseudonocardia sp.]|uniref:AB hydrolase-1 domain-containing protein n=1 Tax=uncultured Pseudonocardia sp. TaxID=211455 RepID=A0A6J4P9B8_9PSEU|nr:MAG: hypothetical protein AVDCRST_MAG66-1958 [uncultured Pseudonocardia sp.]
MTTTTHEAKLEVPGATLHYEVTGSGPVLLLIGGAPADGTIFAGMVPQLADSFTVVTYDHRGYSRSSLNGEPEQQTVAVHADDAHRLLAELTTEPAHVVGLSGGALVGIALANAHPGQVRSLYTYEPAAIDVLDDREAQLATFADVVETYRAQGPFPAAGQFIVAVGDTPPPMPEGEPSPEMLAMMGQMAKNFSLFFEHQLLPFISETPDVEALRATGVPVVWAVGEASQGQPCHRAGVALAARYGAEVVQLPGDHQAATTHPVEFAAAVRAAVTDA